jgi:hypothetical protein
MRNHRAFDESILRSFVKSTLLEEKSSTSSRLEDLVPIDPPSEENKQELDSIYASANMPLFDDNMKLIGYFKAFEEIPKNHNVIKNKSGGLLARRNDTDTAWIVGKFSSQEEKDSLPSAYDASMLDSSLSGKRFAFVEGSHPYVFCIGSLPSGKILLSALRGQHGALGASVEQIISLSRSSIGAEPASSWLSQNSPASKKDLVAAKNVLPGATLGDAKNNPGSGILIIDPQKAEGLKSPISHATQATFDAALSGEVCCYETDPSYPAFSGYAAMKRDLLYFAFSDDDALKIFIMRRISYCLMRQPAWLAWPTVGLQILLGVGGAVVGSMIGPEGTAAGAVAGSRIGALAGMTVSELIANVIGAAIDVTPYIISSLYFCYEYKRTGNIRYKNLSSAALLLAGINLAIDLGLPIGIEQFAKKAALESKGLLYIVAFIAQVLAVAMAEIKIITPALRDDITSGIKEITDSGTLGSYVTEVQGIMDKVGLDSDLGLAYQFGSPSGEIRSEEGEP